MAKKIAAFNWKLNPGTVEEFNTLHKQLKRLAKKYDSVEVVFAPPLPFIGYKHNKDGDQLVRSSQMISKEFAGAHTGEVSAAMIKSVGCVYSIIGHSERRKRYDYSQMEMRNKVTAAIFHKVKPIICFGEDVRDKKGMYIDTLEEQLVDALGGLTPTEIKKVVLAYEPIWAIGSGAKRPINEKELFSTIILIRNILSRNFGEDIAMKMPIIYGGSVKAHNAQTLANVQGVSGFLVGSASHDFEQIEPIISALSK